jgi:hypothetical protein
MNLLRAFLITGAVVAAAVGVMLLVRRRAPAGSYFSDGDRASGVFGVLATGFSILLGFIVFLAFTSYDTSRAGAESEARGLAQQLETAQLFGGPVAAELTAELVCYGRYVAGPEWDRLESGNLGEGPNPWGVRLFRTLRTIDPQTATEEAAYGKWLDQTSDREAARQDRIHGAAGVLPTPLWIVLFVIAFVIFGYMLFFADREERAPTQAMLMGSVVTVITLLMLLIGFLDNPFQRGTGSLRPTAMERTLAIIDRELEIVGFEQPLPCDSRGRVR